MKWITVIAENTPGLLAEVSELLAEKGLDLRDLVAETSGRDCFLTLLLSDYDMGLRVLTEAGYKTVSEEVVLIHIEDKPGALARVARVLADNNIDLRAISMVHEGEDKNAVAISSSNNQEVRRLFREQLVYQPTDIRQS